ncbi:MAG: hypothetical protein AWU56_2539 [Idiomarina sp. T82-3]|nr:MAG: hypothetical protein AWU56_2539 [Idiomarina sp. T82-3]
MIKKKVLSVLSALVVASTSLSVWAACGDSVCGNVGDSYVCYVETAERTLKMCTSESPCSVRC